MAKNTESKGISENFVLILAVVAVIVSIIGFSITYNSYMNQLTGYAVANGTVNVSVTGAALINFTTNNVNFGSGIAAVSTSPAYLYTNGTIVNGNGWTPVASPFVVENIGNVNVSLAISFRNTTAEFIGGSSPEFKYNISNKEATACQATAGFNLNTWYDASTTPNNICDKFQFYDSSDEIYINLWLKIPSDSYTGALSNMAILTYNAA